MEQTTEIVDLDLSANYEMATKGQRFVNYLIDALAFYFIIFILAFLLGIAGAGDFLINETALGIFFLYLFIFAIVLGYYTILEFKFGKTLGKMLTKTKVIRSDNTPLTLRNAFLRSLARLVPFEFISVFFGDGRMWHDEWNDTYVVKDIQY